MPDMQEDRFNCLDFMSTMDLQILERLELKKIATKTIIVVIVMIWIKSRKYGDSNIKFVLQN